MEPGAVPRLASAVPGVPVAPFRQPDNGVDQGLLSGNAHAAIFASFSSLRAYFVEDFGKHTGSFLSIRVGLPAGFLSVGIGLPIGFIPRRFRLPERFLSK